MPNRRQVLSLFALLAGARALADEKPKGSGDNGIGGTGLKPADNGIGGTGFIGTIRKFGSVWVNGERIAYPSDVRIRIDGEPAAPSALRIGQVARLVAERRDETWTTDGIVIVSEVVGPIARIQGAGLEVLGQSVLAPSVGAARAFRVGERVAVSGLRRPDQTIVASLIEKRDGGPDQIAGLLQEVGADFQIGGQRVTGAGGGVVGERVILRGAMENGVFAAREVKLDTVIAVRRRAKNFGRGLGQRARRRPHHGERDQGRGRRGRSRIGQPSRGDQRRDRDQRRADRQDRGVRQREGRFLPA